MATFFNDELNSLFGGYNYYLSAFNVIMLYTKTTFQSVFTYISIIVELIDPARSLPLSDIRA
jgi:hypothetical protein